MTIGIAVNKIKDAGLETTRKLVESIYARGGRAVLIAGVESDDFICPIDLLRIYKDSDSALSGCDVLLCIGGDGTLIKAAHETLYRSVPLLGINMGSLGYLTEVETSQTDLMLDRIFDRDYKVEDRMMLSVTREAAPGGESPPESPPDAPPVAAVLNELAVGRGDSPHVVKLKLYIDGVFIDIYPGDGILVSTPTGSTAYSLSAGGPIVDPELNAISIVPVCPHVVFSRPLLISPDKEISIVPVAADGVFSATVSTDGFRRPDLREGEVLTVRRSEHVVKMLRFNENNFYVTLKNKLFQTSGKYSV